LIVLPDPVAPFRGARIEQSTEVRLGEGASALVVDTVTCGRTAHGERWNFERYASRTTLVTQGRVVLQDHLVLDPVHGALVARMKRFDAFASVFVLGPAFEEIARSVLGDNPPTGAPDELIVGASPIAGGAVMRVAGRSVDTVSRLLRERFAALPGLLGDDPFARKW
jgi:urease accessory protein